MRCVSFAHLVVEIDQIIGSLGSLTFKMNGFELFTWSSSSVALTRAKDDHYKPIRTAVLLTWFIRASIPVNEFATA